MRSADGATTTLASVPRSQERLERCEEICEADIRLDHGSTRTGAQTCDSGDSKDFIGPGIMRFGPPLAIREIIFRAGRPIMANSIWLGAALLAGRICRKERILPSPSLLQKGQSSSHRTFVGARLGWAFNYLMRDTPRFLYTPRPTRVFISWSSIYEGLGGSIYHGHLTVTVKKRSIQIN
jgi:hypothetical protein